MTRKKFYDKKNLFGVFVIRKNQNSAFALRHDLFEHQRALLVQTSKHIANAFVAFYASESTLYKQSVGHFVGLFDHQGFLDIVAVCSVNLSFGYSVGRWEENSGLSSISESKSCALGTKDPI